jgi:hypothetical protein
VVRSEHTTAGRSEGCIVRRFERLDEYWGELSSVNGTSGKIWWLSYKHVGTCCVLNCLSEFLSCNGSVGVASVSPLSDDSACAVSVHAKPSVRTLSVFIVY